MKIVHSFPPNYVQIKRRFKLTGKEIFAWGDTIFNPTGEKLPIQLVAHEKVHQKQQGDDVEGWWNRYLKDSKFRFDQELEAHQIEYLIYCKVEPSRSMRRGYLSMMSKRLASAMYGNVVTKEAAKKLIKNAPA